MRGLIVSWPPAGRYILAVSGGADSMVLLDLFARTATERDYELIVAHFDHGLRSTSGADAQFVAAAATRYSLPYEHRAAKLGRANEAAARAARHAWLEAVRTRHHATAILTAHHQDDQLETSLLNLARGSGRLGLAPMTTSTTILRPLIAITRAALRAYAALHHIAWREDPTNADPTNPRNFLRHHLLPVATPAWQHRYLELITELNDLNATIDQILAQFLAAAHSEPQTYSFDTQAMRALKSGELEELIAAAARRLVPGVQLDRRLIVEVAAFARTGRSGTYRPLRQGIVLKLEKGTVILTTNAPL